jgi:hypothetical protein
MLQSVFTEFMEGMSELDLTTHVEEYLGTHIWPLSIIPSQNEAKSHTRRYGFVIPSILLRP